MDLIGDVTRHYLHIPIVMGSILIYGFLLYHVFFKPVRKVIDARREKIETSAALSVKAREESLEKLEIYEARLSEARKQGAMIRERVRQEVLQYQAKLLEEVKKEIEEKNMLRDKEFTVALENAEKQLKAIIPDLASKMADKVLKRRVAA
jgi:F-type H+-transporting ATPase subunit b